MAIRKWLEPPKAAQSRLSAIIDQLGPGAKAEGTAQDPGRRHERAGLSRGIAKGPRRMLLSGQRGENRRYSHHHIYIIKELILEIYDTT